MSRANVGSDTSDRGPSVAFGHSIHDDAYYSQTRPANLFLYQQRSRRLLQLMARARLLPLGEKRMLDVGCGAGQQLLDFETWGARRHYLAGIDLNDSRVCQARTRLSSSGNSSVGADIRSGNAADLPWPAATFDIVHQSVVFTSILDGRVKRAVAAEMQRVLKPGGAIIWYDFLYDNPHNASVKGIGAREIRSLFPGCTVKLQRITLAPPVARRLVPVAWPAALLLEQTVLFNTHYLGLIQRPNGAG